MTSTIKAGEPGQMNLDGDGMERKVGFLGLLWASEGSIIGSGWLFGALAAAGIAGPSALISWVIGSIIILVLALVHAELGGLFPVTGGTSRFPHYAFGSLAGATFGWFTYIQAAAVAPIEVLAAIQYASSYDFARTWYVDSKLSGTGIVVAVIFMVVFVVVNLIGVSFLAKVNNGLTTWKVLLPVFAVLVLVIGHFHGSNFSAGGGFFIHGSAVKSIVIAIPTGGIVFALLGFEQAVQLGGESKNPKKDLPRAVILSIFIGALVYIGAQVAFIGALDPALLSHGQTWSGLVDGTTTNTILKDLQGAPFYEVASLAGVGWLAFLLRLDAIVSPTGTGLIYLTSASRISFGLSKNGYIPTAFERNSPKKKIPVFGILVTAGIGLIFLLPFPSWGALVGVVTSASVLMYAAAPLALGALRLQKPDLPRAYRLPMGHIMSPVAFILANFIIMWSGWGTYTTLMLVLVIGYLLMAASAALRMNPNQTPLDWAAAVWLFPYLFGIGVISYFAEYGSGGIVGGVGVFNTIWLGGDGRLGLGWDMLVMAGFSLVIYYIAMSRRLSTEQVDKNVRDVYPPPLDAH